VPACAHLLRPLAGAYPCGRTKLTPYGAPLLFIHQVITALKNVPAAFGLILTNAQTGEGAIIRESHSLQARSSTAEAPCASRAEYGDDASLVTDGSRLMVRRVPISRLSASSAGGTASAGNLCVISPAACNALPAGSDPSVEACPLRSLSVCGSIARRSLSSGSMVLCGCTRASEACLQDYAQGECCTCKTLFLSLWRSRCPPKHHSALMLRTPEHQPAAAIWRPQRMCIAACGHARSPLCATAPLPRSLSRLRTALCAKHPDPNQTPSSRLSQLMYVQRGRSTCADGDISSKRLRSRVKKCSLCFFCSPHCHARSCPPSLLVFGLRPCPRVTR